MKPSEFWKLFACIIAGFILLFLLANYLGGSYEVGDLTVKEIQHQTNMLLNLNN